MCRGYIKRGRIYHNANEIVGSGYVSAFENERNVSVFKQDANERGTPFIEVDPEVVRYVGEHGDACVKQMFDRMVSTDGQLTAIFPFKRLNHSFMIGGFGMPKFDAAKELKSLNNVRGWIVDMKAKVTTLVNRDDPSAVSKGDHYIRMLDEQLRACDKTQTAIEAFGQPFPRR
jgi:hypothetical protein